MLPAPAGISLEAVDFDPFAAPLAPAPIPSTEAQREIYTSILIGGDAANCAFNESVTLRIRGALDRQALRQAFATVQQDRDALRARFVDHGTAFCIDAHPPLLWTETMAAGGENPETRLGQAAAAQVRAAFDLARAPLIRAQLLCLGEQDHALLLTAHHIVCDGWSLSLILRDLGQYYSAQVLHETPSLASAASFATHAASAAAKRGAAQEQGQAREQEQSEAYWLAQYADDIPVLDLPTDHARPAQRAFNARRIDVPLPAATAAGLRLFARKRGVSFVTLLLAAFEVFLYRMTGQNDLVVGLPAAGQSSGELANLVGHCVNLLPLRTRIEPQQAFADYLLARRARLLDDLDHRHITFGQLIQKLNLPRDASRIPLAPVAFNVDIGFTEGFRFAGCQFELSTNPRVFENFELFLNLAEAGAAGENLVLECTFNCGLFTADMMRLRMASFVQLLDGILAAPDTPVARFDLITAAERERLAAFNATRVHFRSPIGIHECIGEKAGKLHADHLAIVADGRQITYQTLCEDAQKVAAGLQARGVRPGVPIGVCLHRTADLPAVLLGVLKAGAAYVPLDPAYPAARLQAMLDDANADFVISTPELQNSLQLPPERTLFAETLLHDSDPSRFRAMPVDKESLAYVLYTSGSTGKPKGIAIRHAAVTNLLNDLGPRLRLNASTRFLALTTISFDISVLELFLPLMRGAQLHIATRAQAQDPEWIARYLDAQAIRFVQATPSTYEMLLAARWRGKRDLSLLCGGEALRVELAEKLVSANSELWNLYGPTETTIWSTAERITIESSLRTRNGLCTIGAPVANTRVFVMDAQGEPCPLGVIGELWIGGEGLAAGYHHLPGLTREKFVPAPDGDGSVFKTGDRVQMDGDGRLYFLSRLDHQLKIRGYRIEPGEVESALCHCPGIGQAVVQAVPDQTKRLMLAAWFVPLDRSADERQIVAECRRQLAAQLPEYMIPTAWVRMDALPLTPNLKIDRRALPAPDNTAAHGRPPHPESLSALQQTIRQLWQNILGVDDVRCDDNFFSLGGHSLLAVKLMVELEKATGKKLPLAVLFSHSTIRELARLCEKADDAKLWNPVVPLRAGDDSPALFFAHGISGNVFKYHALSQHLPGKRPCHGLQAVGLNGIDTPLDDMQAMAAYHIAAMRKLQPKGPYHLAGGSFGGYLAYEMAVQLQAAGEKTGFLCLCDIEACKISDFLPVGAKQLLGAVLFSGRAVKRAVALAAASEDERHAYFENRRKRLQGPAYESWLDKHRMAEIIGEEPAACFKDVEEACYRALMTYKIPPYSGDILLVRAKNGSFNNEYAYDLGWSHFVKGHIDIVSVSGDHNSIFWEPNASELAQSIGEALERTAPQR